MATWSALLSLALADKLFSKHTQLKKVLSQK
jgi:hypothetical protein